MGTTQECIALANDLEHQIEALREKQDALLEPIATELAKEMNGWVAPIPQDQRSAMVARIETLPRGFYRSELRVLLESMCAATQPSTT